MGLTAAPRSGGPQGGGQPVDRRLFSCSAGEKKEAHTAVSQQHVITCTPVAEWQVSRARCERRSTARSGEPQTDSRGTHRSSFSRRARGKLPAMSKLGGACGTEARQRPQWGRMSGPESSAGEHRAQLGSLYSQPARRSSSGSGATAAARMCANFRSRETRGVGTGVVKAHHPGRFSMLPPGWSAAC